MMNTCRFVSRRAAGSVRQLTRNTTGGAHFHGPGCSCCNQSLNLHKAPVSSPDFSSRLFSSATTVNGASESTHEDIMKMTSGHDDIAELLKNNEKWVAESQEKDPDFFKRIGGKQTPKYLYIGCSDSRVPANEILGLRPGEVFVHRNVGNLVVGSDLNVLSVVEFAVQHLGVQHIIVTGHYDCGAVRASMTKQDLGLLENWIRNIRDVHRMHHKELDMIDDDEMKHRRLVELSVVEQCITLFKTGVVQRKRKEYRDTHNSQRGDPVFPAIHAMVFDPKVGLLKKLPVKFSSIVRNYQHIYNLY